MSRENVEVIRAGYDAFARGDVDGVLSLIDAEVEWAPAVRGLRRVPSEPQSFVRDYDTRAEALGAAGLRE